MAKTYVMECFWPGVTEALHDEAVSRAEVAARALQADGRPVRFLGGALMPTDEVAFYRFAAQSTEDVKRAGDLAKLPYERVLEYVERPGGGHWRGP